MSAPLAYFVREALRQAWRQRLLSLVALSSLTLAALAGGSWLLLLGNAEHWKKAVGQQLELVAYLKPALPAGGQEAALAQARALSGCVEAVLVSPEEEAAKLGQDPELKAALETLGENPLVGTLRVKAAAKNPVELKAFGDALAQVPGVESVDSGEGALDSMLKVVGTLQAALLGLGALLSAVAFVIVAAGVRLAAQSRRTELGIMRMVGASHGFIRTPFIIEGLGIGALAGGLASLTLAFLQGWLAARLLSELQVDLALFLPQGLDLKIAIKLVAGSALLGALGSGLALASVGLAYEEEEA